MKHSYTADGYCYRLRPVKLEDAQFIIKVRLEDKERTRYIHPIPDDVSLEEQWINRYFQREGDYFFVVETKEGIPIGTSSVYNIHGDQAEGGRILLYGTPLQNAEAAVLGYDFAFSVCGLKRMVLTVLEDNIHVRGFVKKFGAKEEFRKYNNEFHCDMIYYYVTDKMYQEKRGRIMRSIEMLEQI